MSMIIMRRIKFCAGHRLHQHGGKCEFFHGHNYVADFYVTADEVDDIGRVIDFADLKKMFKGWIDEHWDHGFLLHKNDENGIHAIKQVVPSKYYIMPYNPTAESMARYLLENVSAKLLEGSNVRPHKVIVWETEDAFAEARVACDDLDAPVTTFASTVDD